MEVSSRIDHIVIAASDLEQGVDYIRDTLGVEIPAGGRHEMMGTWNKVMSLGNGVYLELIAINPDMQPPIQPRWFGLDDPHVRQSLASGPKLLTWAVNTHDLESLVSSSSVPLGRIQEAQRDSLKWKVAISEDGRMPASGFLPLCIQWLVDFHPSEKMADLGVSFAELRIHHSRSEWLESALDSIGGSSLVSVHETPDNETDFLELVMNTPHGEVTLTSN